VIFATEGLPLSRSCDDELVLPLGYPGIAERRSFVDGAVVTLSKTTHLG